MTCKDKLRQAMKDYIMAEYFDDVTSFEYFKQPATEHIKGVCDELIDEIICEISEECEQFTNYDNV